MSLVTLEVEIDDGKLTAREPHLLPDKGVGLLTVLPGATAQRPEQPRRRVSLPLVRRQPGALIAPTPAELDESLWS